MEVNTIFPVAAPGLAAIPVHIISQLTSGDSWGCNNSVIVLGSIFLTATLLSKIPSKTKSTTIFMAALADLLAGAASKSHNFSSSIVKSSSSSSLVLILASFPNSQSFLKISGKCSSKDLPRSSFVKKSELSILRESLPCDWLK